MPEQRTTSYAHQHYYKNGPYGYGDLLYVIFFQDIATTTYPFPGTREKAKDLSSRSLNFSSILKKHIIIKIFLLYLHSFMISFFKCRIDES